MPLRSAEHFSLTIDSIVYPFVVDTDDAGSLRLNDGIAPMLAPQVRTAGFGYDHTPPNIEVVEPAEQWSEGAGFDRQEGVAGRYNYTRYIDVSWGRAFLQLERQTTLESDGTAIGGTPVKLLYSATLGLFLLAGMYIYKWDLSSMSWVQKDDASGDAVNYVDIIEMDGVLYASRGSATAYKYSTDGTTWTAFSDSATYPDVFTVRGNGSDVAGLWGVIDNVIKVTTDGKNSGVAWSGSDEIGHTSENTRSAVTVDDNILVFKDTGIYLYTGTASQDKWKTDYVTSNNGKNAFVGANRKVYVPYGTELLEFDPATVYGGTSLEPVYPAPGMTSPELLGIVTAVGGSNKHLYLALKNSDGNTYIMKGRNNGRRFVWDTFAYLGANDCNTLLYVAPGVMHATNPTLAFGYGTAVNYLVLPRGDLYPVDDANCTFEDNVSGVYYGSYKDWGAATFPKFLNRGAVLGNALSAGRTAALYYEADRSGTETSLVTASGNGLTSANEESEVSFNILRDIVYMTTLDNGVSPQVEGWLLGATLNPPRHRMWAPVVKIVEHGEFRGGSKADSSTPDARTVRNVLKAAVTKRVTLALDGFSYFVRIEDVIPIYRQERRNGNVDEETTRYQIVMYEVSTLTTDEPVLYYDNNAYDAGYVLGAS